MDVNTYGYVVLPARSVVGAKVKLAKDGDRGSKAIKATKGQAEEIERIRKKLTKKKILDKKKKYRGVLRKIYKEGRMLSQQPRLFFEERSETNKEAVRTPKTSTENLDKILKKMIRGIEYSDDRSFFKSIDKIPIQWLNQTSVYNTDTNTNLGWALEAYNKFITYDSWSTKEEGIWGVDYVLSKIPSPLNWEIGELSAENLEKIKDIITKIENENEEREPYDFNDQKTFELSTKELQGHYERLNQVAQALNDVEEFENTVEYYDGYTTRDPYCTQCGDFLRDLTLGGQDWYFDNAYGGPFCPDCMGKIDDQGESFFDKGGEEEEEESLTQMSEEEEEDENEAFVVEQRNPVETTMSKTIIDASQTGDEQPTPSFYKRRARRVIDSDSDSDSDAEPEDGKNDQTCEAKLKEMGRKLLECESKLQDFRMK